MKEIDIDLYNAITLEETDKDIVVRGSYCYEGVSMDCYYSYPKYKDNKLRRFYAREKIHKQLCKMMHDLFYNQLEEWVIQLK